MCTFENDNAIFTFTFSPALNSVLFLENFFLGQQSQVSASWGTEDISFPAMKE